MLDLQLLRDDPDRVKKAMRDKGAGDPSLVDRVLEVDEQRRAAQTELQQAQTELNASSKQIGRLMGQGKRDEAQALIQRTADLKQRVKELDEEPKRLEDTQRRLLLEIPNLPHPSVPIGHSEEENVVVAEHGDQPQFDFEPKPHWELAEAHGLLDFERGAKVAGAGFPFYLGKGARLQRALIQFFLDLAAEAGYTEMQPPLVVNEASGIGTGQLPDKEGLMYRVSELSRSVMSDRAKKWFQDLDLYLASFVDELSHFLTNLPDEYQDFRSERDRYASLFVDQAANERIKSDIELANQLFSRIQRPIFELLRNPPLDRDQIVYELYYLYLYFDEGGTCIIDFATAEQSAFLIPTAEVPVTNFFRDEILDADALPTKFAAYTPCFRREAGSHGKDVRGLNRLHQFDKVELVQFVHPDQSYDALEALREDAERAVQRLGLPYRRLLMCTGDMGFTQSKKYDLEVWSGGQGRWLEVSSVSNFEAYQARRANIRFRPEDGGKPQFVHTLNGSALALPRIVAALLENNQQADGSISIPEALRPYTGFDRIG